MALLFEDSRPVARWALALLLTGAGCAGETIEPGRAPNHPANPSTAEAPFSMPPRSLGGTPAMAAASDAGSPKPAEPK